MKREIMLSILNHEENIVPSWTMSFFNTRVAKRLLGEENVITDFEPIIEYKVGGCDESNRKINIRYSEAVDNFAIGVGKGANFAFGHGGPGEFMDRIIKGDENYYISQFETGVKREVRFCPSYFYQHFNYPIDVLDKINNVYIPEANDEKRFNGIKEDVKYYKQNGYFTYANINGFFSGLHYFFYPFDKLFIAMLENKEELKILIKKLATFNLTSAEQLLKRGVDCITFCDDLGSGESLLFSPDLYKELFYPYHKQLADLCHSYGAFVHMHSHGNIMKIIDLIVEAGIDMINPIDPFEGMELSYLKEKYGDRITLVGGMDKFFFEWGKEKMNEYLTKIIKYGRKNGGYILMDSGGIPENISKEKYDFYRKISKKIRYKV